MIVIAFFLLLWRFVVDHMQPAPSSAPSSATKAVNTDPVTIWPHGVSPLGVKHKEDFGDHALSVTVHNTSGGAETHEATADVMVIESGEATLVYGGEIADAKRTAPHEVRGTSIRNGTSVHVSAGDVVHFAAGAPHQWLVDPGKQITYLVVHVEQPQATR